jgi:DNA-binding response OmpR family regulator
VLVVEDDPMLAGIIGRLVTASGGHAHVMTKAYAALHSLRRQRFDLLITDLCLDDGSGYDVAKMARAQQPDMLIAVSSGILGTEDDRPPEADIYLHKPFRLATIRQLVSQVAAA